MVKAGLKKEGNVRELKTKTALTVAYGLKIIQLAQAVC